jgi:hypothetical protein
MFIDSICNVLQGSFAEDVVFDEQYNLIEIPIDILDILEYIDHSSRCLREGIRLEVSNSIANLFVVQVKDNTTYYLKGECLSSHTTRLVYEFTLILCADYKQWKLCCACPAGIAGKCKHVIAGLKFVER